MSLIDSIVDRKLQVLKQMAGGPAAPTEFRRDWPRYLRVATFFAGAFLSFIWWELIAGHLPLIGSRVRRGSLARWQQVAQRYRRLAIRYGGVLIKLGQFLSIRVDVLPLEITAELAGLQDEVPAETPADIQKVIAGEFDRPIAEVFAWFSPEPLAAASLAQVHRARLHLAEGEPEVVVKVQRPRIEMLVETDLAAIRLAARWLKWYRQISARIDLDRLYEEFAATTRRELDFVEEGHNCEHFAADFAADAGIYIAKVYWETTTRRVLTLENVAGIKITDTAAMEAAGISRSEVARRLYDTYLQQIFVTHFVHADPHPGNLFLRPVEPAPDALPDAPRPFKIVFVDFGMVAVVPEELRAALREFVIALATRDAHGMVQSYVHAGVLLPGADLQRLEEVHEALFKRFGGVRMGQLRDVAFEQAEFMFREYRDLIYEMPFQFPADMLFAVRAVAILSGLATTLDPDFDPWSATLPFAERLAVGELTRDWRGYLERAVGWLQLLARLPGRLDRLATQAERGALTVQTALAPDHAKALRRIERAVDRQTWMTLAVGLLVAGALLRATPGSEGTGLALFIGAGVAFLWGLTRR
jgi:predicted unusual protein kinase regulating ubiquinone biosynthesis (AarF/ABC1/UbiB family)